MWIKTKSFILDLLFPKFCLYCKKEGDYICEDCRAVLEVSGTHQKLSTENIDDIYFPLSYQNYLAKNLVDKLKSGYFFKELGEPLSSLIIEHFQLLDNKPDFSEFILIPVPLGKSDLKRQGFNPAEEIGKALAIFLKIPLFSNCLVKESFEDGFCFKNPNIIKIRKIILIDSIYSPDSKLEICARVLKGVGAKEIIGILVAKE